MTTFKRGLYNEIIPPPLFGGADPEQAINELAQAVAQKTGAALHRPQRGKSRAGLEQLAALYVHQKRLVAALAGENTEPMAMAIRILVEDAGEPLSLRPAFLDNIHHLSFVPLLQKAGGAWRVGIPGRGKHQVIAAASCAEAFLQAQRLYNTWVEEENKIWHGKMKEAAGKITPDVLALVWELQLRCHGEVAVAPDYRFERWGGHGQYALWLPSQQFFAFTAASPQQAALYMRVMAAQKGLSFAPATSGQVQELLRAVLPPVVQAEGNRYVAGELVAQLESHRITIRRRGQPEGVGYTQIRHGVAEAFRQGESQRQAPRLLRQLAFPAEWNAAERQALAVLWSLYSWL